MVFSLENHIIQEAVHRSDDQVHSRPALGRSKQGPVKVFVIFPPTPLSFFSSPYCPYPVPHSSLLKTLVFLMTITLRFSPRILLSRLTSPVLVASYSAICEGHFVFL